MRPSFGFIFRSLWTRLALLSVIFLSVPVILYNQFRAADAEKQEILLGAVREQGLVIARSLEGTLARADEIPFVEVAEQLTRYGSPGMHLKLLFKPAERAPEGGGFYYVAAAPPVSVENLDLERRELKERGVLEGLGESCEGGLSLALRIRLAAGREELMTSITPVQTAKGCWALVVSHAVKDIPGVRIGEPYWKSEEIRLAGAIYGAMALLVIGLFLGLWRGVYRFGKLARELREPEAARVSFAERNTIPELSPVAESFDAMVATLRDVAASIRRAAEDNAHAFKTPLGVIRQALEPLRRRLDRGDERVRRALGSIENACERLEGLVASAQRLDEVTAELLDPSREPLDLTELVRRVAEGYRERARPSGIEIATRLEEGITVQGGPDLIETVIENILDNAVGFTPRGGRVELKLERDEAWANLTVEDGGPGVGPDRIERIFERYYSERSALASAKAPRPGDGGSHYGIGLWVVKRNVEALGGRVEAENRSEGGLRVRLRFPLSR